MFGQRKADRLEHWNGRRRSSRSDEPILRALARPDVLARLGVVALTVLCVTLAASWGSPLALREGHVAAHDVKARVDFAVPDDDPTAPPRERHVRSEILLPQGLTIQERHLELLRHERVAFEADVSVRERLRRGAAIFCVLALLAGSVALYSARFQPLLARSLPMIVRVGVLVLLTVVASLVLHAAPWHAVLLPLTTTAMILTLAYNTQFALMMSFCLMLALGLLLGGDLSDLLVHASGLGAAILLLRHVRTRTQLVSVATVAGLSYAAMTLACGALTGQPWAASAGDAVRNFVWGTLSGFLLTGILPYVERAFGIVTDIRLLELADGSHPLMQELVKRAPGTYTHSMTVATLAEAAAETIGANPLLVRVGSCFHDVGKMLKPHYFIENQSGENRHDLLEPALSTLVIIGHVKDGLALGEEYRLPQPILDFIAQHHGTTLVEYFYREAMRLQEKAGLSHVDLEACFRYPGPKPRSRENGVVMLADAVESTSRSLENPTPASLKKLVHDLLMKRLLDGQFEESGLTLTELHLIEESLSKSLIALFHARIKYPDAPVESRAA